MNINPELVKLAEWRIAELRKKDAPAVTSKEAFVMPGGGDPSGGGAPPPGGDPSMGGGAPPMDPSMGGGMAPPPPSTGPTPVPGGGGLTADSIAQIVTQTMQGGMAGGAAGGAPGAAGAMGKPAKPDINTVAIDIFQVKKMLQFLFNTMGIPLPPDILDGPNRDPSTGTPMPPGAPGSTSDPSVTAANAAQGGAAGAGSPPGGAGGAPPPGGGAGGISPMNAMQPMGGEKMGSIGENSIGYSQKRGFDPSIISRAAALAEIHRRLKVK